MKNQKPIQMISLPETKNIRCVRDKYIVGAVLMDNGRILPVIWDGEFSFQPYDPMNEVWAKFAKRLFDTKPEPDPSKDPQYEKKMEAIKRINGEKESQDDGAEQN